MLLRHLRDLLGAFALLCDVDFFLGTWMMLCFFPATACEGAPNPMLSIKPSTKAALIFVHLPSPANVGEIVYHLAGDSKYSI